MSPGNTAGDMLWWPALGNITAILIHSFFLQLFLEHLLPSRPHATVLGLHGEENKRDCGGLQAYGPERGTDTQVISQICHAMARKYTRGKDRE